MGRLLDDVLRGCVGCAGCGLIWGREDDERKLIDEVLFWRDRELPMGW